jgi:signal transduction histidine kinase/ActR/RegA family two-component response regulator
MGRVELSNQRLLSFAGKLQRAADFAELIEIAREECAAALGYRQVWFMVGDEQSPDEVRLLQFAGERPELIWEHAVRLKVTGDPFLEEVIAAQAPVVIEDARIDPRTNKDIVEKLQNRTIINVPLRMLDQPFGVLGLGTFGDEGCRPPSEAELEYLVGMSSQIAVAVGRIRYLDGLAQAERQRLEFERRLAQMQRLESLGLLAGGIAHDFNNLLTVILASASFAETRVAGDPELEEEIHSVVAAATRARDLTRQLLAMSRAQALELRPVDLNAQVGQLIELLRRVFPETIAIELIRAAHAPSIEGDASQLDQVFMNLCINARDAMPEGGRLTIETEQVLINGRYREANPWAKEGRYVLVTVTDTGVGMAPEVVERIFEPFFTTKPEHTGTGLGLAVTYGIVRQHGGMLHCYSEPGMGTTFKVYLPVLERLATTVGTKVQAAVRSGAERVLVAEDDPAVRAVAVRILERAGYSVSAVEDGDAAHQLALRDPFDLVLLDVVMPGASCQTTVERLRAQRPNLAILLTSGYSAGANIAALQAQTGLGLLRKPYDPDQMLRAVRDALDRREGPP